MPWVGLPCVIVVCPDHTHLLFAKKPYSPLILINIVLIFFTFWSFWEYCVLMESKIPLTPVLGGVGIVAFSIISSKTESAVI